MKYEIVILYKKTWNSGDGTVAVGSLLKLSVVCGFL